MNILFVCTGNTCRSPMAEGLFKDMLRKNNIENIKVSSAGLSVFPGEHVNEKAIRALKEKGIDISSHRAR
ncbi:MAG TPA: low molecular weight protein arginine phosphatase, partial [Tissierellia bacterium]|nr:low molecular weight protein arginine phosphatase [Tissierellia bacterium]